MKDKAIIKAELKRNFWVLLPALFFEFFFCYGQIMNSLENTARNFAQNLGGYYYLPNTLEPLLFCGLVWTFLMVFVQFYNESLVFKQALPYTNKRLIKAKFITWSAVAVLTVLFYVLMMGALVKKYDFLLTAESWDLSMQGAVVTANEIIAAAIAAFLFFMAFYWYCVFCNTVCKYSAAGCGLAFYGCMLVMLLIDLADRFDIRLGSLFNMTEWITLNYGEHAYRYVSDLFLTVFSLVVIAVCLPLSLALYGGGLSKHPLFRYDWAEKVFVFSCMIFGAALFPMLRDAYNEELVPWLIIGAAIGLLTGAGVNLLIKKGAE